MPKSYSLPDLLNVGMQLSSSADNGGPNLFDCRIISAGFPEIIWIQQHVQMIDRIIFIFVAILVQS